MRKALVIAVAIAMVLSLAAVGSAKRVELKFYYPVQVAGPLAKVIEQMVNQFNAEHEDILVQPVYSGSYDETMQKVQTAVMSKNPPDVAVLLAIDLLTLLDTKAIIPLDKYAATDPAYVNDFFAGFLENSRNDGKLWSIPFQRSTPLLYYNREFFANAGLDPNAPPKTWDELLAYAQKLTVTDAAGNVTRYGLNIVTDDTWIFQAFVLQNGGMYCNEAGTEVYFDDPKTIGALQYMVDLANKYKVMPRHRYYGDAAADFVAGQTVMMYNSTGSLSFVRNSATFDFGVAPLPAGEIASVPTGGGNFYVFAGLPPEKEAAAWEFIKWMTTPERVAHWSIESGYIPVRKSALDTELMKDYYAKFPQASVAGEQLSVARREMSLHNNQQIREIVLTAIQEAIDGVATPEEALRKAQRNSERVLRPFQG